MIPRYARGYAKFQRVSKCHEKKKNIYIYFIYKYIKSPNYISFNISFSLSLSRESKETLIIVYMLNFFRRFHGEKHSNVPATR